MPQVLLTGLSEADARKYAEAARPAVNQVLGGCGRPGRGGWGGGRPLVAVLVVFYGVDGTATPRIVHSHYHSRCLCTARCIAVLRTVCRLPRRLACQSAVQSQRSHHNTARQCIIPAHAAACAAFGMRACPYAYGGMHA